MSGRAPPALRASGGVATARTRPARVAVGLRLALGVATYALCRARGCALLALSGLGRGYAVLQALQRLLLRAGHATGGRVLARRQVQGGAPARGASQSVRRELVRIAVASGAAHRATLPVPRSRVHAQCAPGKRAAAWPVPLALAGP